MVIMSLEHFLSGVKNVILLCFTLLNFYFRNVRILLLLENIKVFVNQLQAVSRTQRDRQREPSVKTSTD